LFRSVYEKPPEIVKGTPWLRADFVRVEHRLDRFDERLLRLERRLDLIAA